MTLNLTELKDEPLGKHPSQAAVCSGFLCYVNEAQQDVVAADDESSFTFDVEGLGDEALDEGPSVSAFGCFNCFVGGLGDEALDDSPSVSANFCVVSCRCDGLSDEALDPQPHRSAYACIPVCQSCVNSQ